MPKLAKVKGVTEQKESTEEIESHMGMSILIMVAVKNEIECLLQILITTLHAYCCTLFQFLYTFEANYRCLSPNFPAVFI